MILSRKEPADWTSEHRQILDTFLSSPTGELVLSWLAAHSPSLLDGSDVNKTLVASGIVHGYEKAISEIFSLTREQPAEIQPPTAYPDLDDDTKWNGDKPK